MEEKNGLIIVGGVCLFIIFLAFKFKWFSRKDKTNIDVDVDPHNEIKEIFPLKRGSISPEVKILQIKLNKKVENFTVLKPLIIDGIFGTKTEGLLFHVYNIREVSEKLYNKL